jgi:hypothetical protein
MRSRPGGLWLIAALAMMVAAGCTTRDTPPPQKDQALATRIEQLVDQVLAAEDDARRNTVLADARAIFEREGVPSVARVGDTAAYGFVLINMLAQPPEFRLQFFARMQEVAARQELPADAITFAEARRRQTEIEDRFRGRSPSHPQLRDEISRLYKEDQAVRQREGFDFKKMDQMDRRTGRPLKAILDRHGVPTYDMVGVEAAKGFIIMVQHQPAEFRAAVLPNLKANVDAGQGEPGSYAMVYDRTQRDQGRNQLYGQNFECGAGKQFEVAPLDEPASVNRRRAEMGLMRLELYGRLLRLHSPDMCKSAGLTAAS